MENLNNIQFSSKYIPTIIEQEIEFTLTIPARSYPGGTPPPTFTNEITRTLQNPYPTFMFLVRARNVNSPYAPNNDGWKIGGSGIESNYGLGIVYGVSVLGSTIKAFATVGSLFNQTVSAPEMYLDYRIVVLTHTIQDE